MSTKAQKHGPTLPLAAVLLAERILEGLDATEFLARGLRAAMEDPTGACFEALDETEDNERQYFFDLLKPLLEADPALKTAYYGTDAGHHADILRRGHEAFDLLERIAALPPSGRDIEEQSSAALAVAAEIGGSVAFELMARLPELSAHQANVDKQFHTLIRLVGESEQGKEACRALEYYLGKQRGAIACKTVHSVLVALDGYLSPENVVQVAAAADYRQQP